MSTSFPKAKPIQECPRSVIIQFDTALAESEYALQDVGFPVMYLPGRGVPTFSAMLKGKNGEPDRRISFQLKQRKRPYPVSSRNTLVF